MKRKKNNPAARMQRNTRALLRHNCVAVVHVDPSGRQGLINWKNCKSIAPSNELAYSICEIAHIWTIYLAVFCRSQTGERYIKAAEIAPQGQYRSDQLGAQVIEYDAFDEHGNFIEVRREIEPGVIDVEIEKLLATCNPQHVIGQGWIASPVGESLSEEQAGRIFEAVGCWEEQVAA